MKARRNHLVVIAIDKYDSAAFPKLDNAVIDAKAVIELLTTRYGFELFRDPIFNEAATKETIYQLLNELLTVIEKDDNLIVYFAGHGRMHPLGRQGYWVPYEAKDRIPDLIENSSIKDYLQRIPSKHQLLIVDACFSGTFISQTRGSSTKQTYAALDALNSRWVITSGGEETVLDGKPGQHSPFARYLIRFLKENDNQYTSVRELARYVIRMTENSSRQSPKGAPIENIGDEGGEMVFHLQEGIRSTKETTRGLPNCNTLLMELKAYESKEEQLPAGKEILLIESFINPGDVMIVELFQFDENGKKKHHFSNEALRMTDGEGHNINWIVIRRFATRAGLDRFWETNEAVYKSRNPIFMAAHESIETVGETVAAIEYSDYLKDLLDNNLEPMQCLHCGNIVTQEECSLIEIDEEGLKPAVGNVHNHCLRPLDRIIGQAQMLGVIEHLVSFDFRKWQQLLQRGQFFWQGARQTAGDNEIWSITWNSDYIDNIGEYCIRQILNNGQIKYVRLGREIQRFPGNIVDQELAYFENEYKKMQQEGNPFGYTSKFYSWGPQSVLEKQKQADESILYVTKMEKVRYSKQLETENTSFDFDYAPVGILTAPHSQRTICFGNCIPLIFDISLFEKLYDNWKSIDYVAVDCEIKIIESDKEFDLFLQKAFEEDMQPIVHPQFNKDRELVKGVFILNFKQIIAEQQARLGMTNPLE